MSLDQTPGGNTLSVNCYEADHEAILALLDNNLNDRFTIDGSVRDQEHTHHTAMDSPEDCDFSDVVLKYINQMLMEEDIEEKTLVHEPSAIQAAEKSFYEVIGETYSYPPIDCHPILESENSTSTSTSDCNVGFFGPEGNDHRGKRNPHSDDTSSLEEGRTSKQLAVYVESTVSSEMFDMVLLNGGEGESALRESWKNGQSEGSTKEKKTKKKGRKKEVVDLRTLLTLSAQAVAAFDQRSANELLKKIRTHASPNGDGMQRLAYYFADGLEARLAGSGTGTYNGLLYKPASASDVLKAYQLFLTACPAKKLSNFFSNKTIMNVSDKASKLHIVDFGITYGFQWPSLIERLSHRPGGPPELRITGIDLPQPGLRPTEVIKETGHRLAKYAEKFKVPFKFNAIAQKWETIRIEDIGIKPDEILVVNCIYNLKNLLDETVVEESPRDTVLKLIKQMNPRVLIHGIVNAGHSAPLFILRFREALFHFSTLFDVLEVNVPRGVPERELIEREILARQAMNVIACEGSERIERPETYKHWQMRNLRAGLQQLPLDKEIVKVAKDRLKSHYHKDFMIEEDGNWLLQGWKGRITYALSTWTAAP